jgi:hypothetical protein
VVGADTVLYEGAFSIIPPSTSLNGPNRDSRYSSHAQ